MKESNWLVRKFEENQERLQNVAYRILGSRADAEDALQETWLRLTQSETDKIDNIGGWLTTVISRICLDMLRSSKLRGGESFEEDLQLPADQDGTNPEGELILADSLGPALLIILEQLGPAERVAFVLHDLFDLPFAEISVIIGRSETATRQLASRARRRIRGVKGAPEDEKVKREVVSAFLAASRQGDLKTLLQLLDPEVVLDADDMAVRISSMNLAKGAPQFDRRMSGAETIAGLFKGKAKAIRLALIDESVGATFMLNKTPLVALTFVVKNRRISHIGVTMDREDLTKSTIKLIEGTTNS